MAKRILTIDLADGRESFDLDDAIVSQDAVGVTVIPKTGKELGYRRLFFPWAEIRRMEERNASN